MQVVGLFEFALESEFPANRSLEFATAPHGDRGLAVVVMTEVRQPDVHLDLLDRHVVDQRDRPRSLRLHFAESRKSVGDVFQGEVHRLAGQGQHRVMGVDRTDVAKAIFEREQFLFEFDPGLPGERRADIDSGRSLQLGMTELHGQLRRPHRPTIVVKRAQPDDKMVVVEIVSRRVKKEHLADLIDECIFRLLDPDIILRRHSFHRVPKILEGLRGRKTLRSQEDFVFAVMQVVVGSVRGIVGELGHACDHPTSPPPSQIRNFESPGPHQSQI